MHYPSINAFLSAAGPESKKGPIAIILIEDDVETGSTLRHHLDLGFKTVLALMPPIINLPNDVADKVVRIDFHAMQPDAHVKAVNAIIPATHGTWLYYCYNAEYLFYPFCETRSVNELLTFHTEERRDAMISYVVDIYADNLDEYPNAVSLEHAHLDKAGYYALGRWDDAAGKAKDRQLNFHGGLRWRYEEHIPFKSQRIDRVSLFKSKPGLLILPDHTFNDDEYNTYACKWHHNLTAAVCSFRTAKALKRNPGSSASISNFKWYNSAKFEWHSEQLLNLGLIEPGQWF